MKGRSEETGSRGAGGWAVANLLATAVFFGLLSREAKPAETAEQAISRITRPGARFYVTYSNAMLITVSGAMTMKGLYDHLARGEGRASRAGLAFVHVYLLMNLFAYGSQLFLPRLLERAGSEEEAARLAPLVHGYGGSCTQKVNAAAYAALGIPSITFGRQLLVGGAVEKASGSALVSSAVADFVGLAGVLAGSRRAGAGLIVGGAFYLVALVALVALFLRR